MNQKKAKRLRRLARAESERVVDGSGKPLPQRRLVQRADYRLNEPASFKDGAINHPKTFRGLYQRAKRDNA